MANKKIVNMAKLYRSGWALFLCACVITSLAYLPGLGGAFMHDDQDNILHNKYVQLDKLTLRNLSNIFRDRDTGVHKILSRAVANLSFVINYRMSGLEPYSYKLTNLAIHLLTGAAIFLLITLMARATAIANHTVYPPLTAVRGRWIALLTAVFWLIHPLHVSTVMYIVQRMAQLATLFTVLGLCAYVWYRIAELEKKGARNPLMLSIGLFVFWPLAILSKENAIVLPLLCLVIEFTLFRFVAMDLLLKRLYWLLAWSVVGVSIYFLYKPDFILGGYPLRDFTPFERLLTQSRVLWGYVHSLFLPDITRMGLFLDDFPLSRGFLTPVTTAVSIIAWGVAVLLAILWRRRVPMFSFAVLWFLAAHSVESSIIGLEIAYEHRNYLPSIGVIAFASWGVLALHYHYAKLRPLLKTAGVLTVIMFASLTFLRSHQWSDVLIHAQAEARNHPRSYRSNVELARLLLEARRTAEAEVFFNKAKDTERPFANHYIMLLAMRHLQGREQEADALYQEVIDILEVHRLYPIILAQINYHIYLAKANGWSNPHRLIELVQALIRNPYLQGPFFQAHLRRALATLYSDIGEQSLMREQQKISADLLNSIGID